MCIKITAPIDNILISSKKIEYREHMNILQDFVDIFFLVHMLHCSN